MEINSTSLTGLIDIDVSFVGPLSPTYAAPWRTSSAPDYGDVDGHDSECVLDWGALLVLIHGDVRSEVSTQVHICVLILRDGLILGKVRYLGVISVSFYSHGLEA